MMRVFQRLVDRMSSSSMTRKLLNPAQCMAVSPSHFTKLRTSEKISG
jgi:hypothetical protein